MREGKVIIGVLSGLTAGALAGILFAPDKGSKTRKRIITKGEQYVRGLKQNLNDMMQGADEKSDQVKQHVKEFDNKNKEKLQEAEKVA